MAGAVNIAGPKRRSRRRGGRSASWRPMAEINVTPMVDVMLVLLVIFMITAPLLTAGIPVNLPQTKADALSEPTEPLVVTVNGEGKIYLQETEVPLESLVARLQAITANKPDTKIYVRGDKAINYGRVMEVMGLVKSAGFAQVALIVEQPAETQTGTQIGN
ncbi:protein TolR [Hypericibacter terrae]|jgi:biopolymer transport protein TolR|uniref:Protein TolR n=1 Tax=Hypericibacter terrae TaxID=2602015 RepID=A0A5J6MN77_9PROT|nr:protein TolR [Hypericibacter terrae]QEX18809.1 protein TolR [Hypericibacter terrae]